MRRLYSGGVSQEKNGLTPSSARGIMQDHQAADPTRHNLQIVMAGPVPVSSLGIPKDKCGGHKVGRTIHSYMIRHDPLGSAVPDRAQT